MECKGKLHYYYSFFPHLAYQMFDMIHIYIYIYIYIYLGHLPTRYVFNMQPNQYKGKQLSTHGLSLEPFISILLMCHKNFGIMKHPKLLKVHTILFWK